VTEWSCPVPSPPGERILLGHGAGGLLSARLVRDVFLSRFAPGDAAPLTDAAVIDIGGIRLAFTTDAFVVTPRSFAGGDLGALAINGTVNDLAMMRARPEVLSAAFVIEEGLALAELERIAESMAEAAHRAGVRLVTGDTKVVERGAADGLFVVTSGIGVVPAGVEVSPRRMRPGDAVIVSGPVGGHGVAVLSRRAGIELDVDVRSDTAPLTPLVDALAAVADVRCLRDATRGGVATVLCELAEAGGLAVTVDEATVPVDGPVRAACAVLGLDPLYVANEGVFVAVVAPEDVGPALEALHGLPGGRGAVVIGEVHDGVGVHLRTGLGVTRPLLMLAGEQLPRIC
jgi:hydrogenase expression/formation protein HypE